MFGIEKKKTLDYQECYNLWAKERISPYKIADLFYERGITHPITGKKFTHQAIWRGAYIYALENLVEAKTDAQAICSQYGIVFNEDTWYRSMVNKAAQFLKGKQYQEYMNKNAFLKQYE